MPSRVRALALLLLPLTAGACGGEPPPPPVVRTAVPEAHLEGERRFAQACATCHGARAEGTALGPPLVHSTYRPDHHADAAFVRAVQLGVRAHHWRFGDMPPVPGLSAEEVDQIVGFVRWLQREAGVY